MTRLHESGLTLSGFAAGLLGVGEADVDSLANEVRSDRRFHDAMEDKKRTPAGKRVPRASVNDEVGTILYVICRTLRPDDVVETGVASGVSSSYFLRALDKNAKGRLHSIDFPTWESDTGWIVPDELRRHWELIVGRSSERLPPLLQRLGTIQVFFHDGEHTYENMMWEYEKAWALLPPGGILLSHNIDFTEAFPDFARSIGEESRVFQNLGGVTKPGQER